VGSSPMTNTESSPPIVRGGLCLSLFNRSCALFTESAASKSQQTPEQKTVFPAGYFRRRTAAAKWMRDSVGWGRRYAAVRRSGGRRFLVGGPQCIRPTNNWRVCSLILRKISKIGTVIRLKCNALPIPLAVLKGPTSEEGEEWVVRGKGGMER